MYGPTPGERQLVPHWSFKLVLLSYFISWLGAYTSTQIVIHAKYSRVRVVRWLWTFLASLAFGFTAIWSMHFVGMLACSLDVRITFNIPLTILSAVVAVTFTFIAFSTGDTSKTVDGSTAPAALASLGRSLRVAVQALRGRVVTDDVEAGRRDDEHRPMLSGDSDHADEEEDEYDAAPERSPDSEWRQHRGNLPHRVSTDSTTLVNGPTSHVQTPNPSDNPTRKDINGQHQRRPRFPTPASSSEPAQPEPTSSRTSEDSSLTPSSEDSTFVPHHESTSGSSSRSAVSALSARSWSEPLHAGLSREARLRIKAQARDRPVPKFGWRYWFKAYCHSITLYVALRAAVWGLAIVFMHYCGMWAMVIPEGRIEWNWAKVVLSYVVAYSVCFVGCIAMLHMEVHFGRQVAFSTIAAFGCSSMHYTGMWAATFYTKAPPSTDPGYPAFMPYVVLIIAVFVCVVSNGMLAHVAIISRNRMAEVILTKRRIWRIMAEKEAAEQANELKQQFISVASHEIRTPLHAVNGYCELLAMTNLSEEQRLYVTSIQQACHAINVIAGNVLDFSKLDRNNVEMSARPVLVDLRKMVEDQARIIETKGSVHPQPAVDIVVSIADNVPTSMYLDETYTFRILMNLLSNAQKFCEEGYVCVAVTMDSDTQVAIRISDTGCGIPKSFRSALFQPFRQADSSLTRPKQGTGLGLSIVKHLVQRMSGTVDVESVEGEGSIFTVKLPITLPTTSPPHPDAPVSITKRLKVVYRHERTARLYVDLWNRHGMSASVANPGIALAELVADTDAVWADIESVKTSKTLQALMSADADGESNKLPPLFIVHGDAQELTALQPALSNSPRVVLVKRPVILSALMEIVRHPDAHLGTNPVQSRVRFALPQGQAQAGGRTPMEESIDMFGGEAATASVAAGTGERILLVEDNMINQHLGKRLLEKLGYQAVTANNGQEAVDKVLENPFHCCFMDCQMPVLDGFAAATKIREMENNGTIHGRLPIIALTANVSAESEEKCRAAGMDHFLPKPFKMTDLQAVLAFIKATHQD